MMSYKIVYGPVNSKQSLRRQLGRRILVKLVVAALVIGLRFVGVGDMVRQWLIPGDAAVTAAAWEGMTEEIKGGEQISTAFADFCRRIIENAGIS